MNNFVYLENHSVYSLCEGTIYLEDLVDFAVKNRFPYLSICDTNGFYGLMNFISLCKDTGLKYLISVRIRAGNFSAILIARNISGYSKICSILTAMNLEKGFLEKDFLGKDFNLKSNILSKCNNDYYIITNDKELIIKGGSNVYAEINVLDKNYASLYKFAKSRKRKTVLIHPVYFLNKEGYNTHKILRAIYHNKKLCALKTDETADKNAYFRKIDEIVSQYSFMPDAIENTKNITESASFNFETGNLIFPEFNEDSFQMLRMMCEHNIRKRYSNNSHIIMNRLNKELEIIRDKGFANYFLIVQDVVKKTNYTCGRGSAAASLVSYLLFITHVDPIKHNLFFERFLNRNRTDPPDIDVDFPWDTRDEILDYIFMKYSENNTAMVSNHITFSVRSSIREIAKVYGIPKSDIDRITKSIDSYFDRSNDQLDNCFKRGINTEQWQMIYKQAKQINGIPRHLSTHCGGVIITPKPVCHYIPVEKATKGVKIIQFEKDQAEDFGFVKIDILGNRSLAVVRDTLGAVKEHYGIEIEYKYFNPIDNKKTINMMASGNTMGVFYVESPAMIQLQRKTGYGDYEHLIIHSSIIRPAANNYIREYIERLKGKPYKSLLPEMDEILKETYGIMCYQEDITRISMKIAGFSLAQGEELRKVITKKNKQRRKLEIKQLFYSRLVDRNVNVKLINKIWNMIESFSGYSFCKPHSASYALLSFKSCYLKTYYPAEFMGAVLKNRGGFYSPLAYVSEARRMGLKIIMPDINMSRNEYFGYRDRVYIGFMQIKDLSSKTVEALIKERNKNGVYRGLRDFIRRTNAQLSDIIILINTGCFDNIESYNRPQLLFITKKTFKSHRRDRYFSELIDYQIIRPPDLKGLSFHQKIKNEIDSFGSIFSIHPMIYYRTGMRINTIRAKDIKLYKGKNIKIAGILITSKTVLTKYRELMRFVSFEDETAVFETVLFPEAYKKFAMMLSYQRPYIIEGKVDIEFGVPAITISRIKFLI